jgi:hypothetical protein
MDTRYWGPSGWRMLHMITFAYKPEKQKNVMRQFFEVLPFVLPCKYCRSNLIEHYEALPLEPALQSRETLIKWLYDIHNLVSEKLRSQGQTVPDPPPFSAVKHHYEERLAYGCSKTFFPGWEFLFSILESHPLSKSEHPLPFPNAPPKQTLKTQKQLLQWNYLSGSCRFNYVCRFWRLLPEVLPFEEWRAIWKRHTKNCCSKTWSDKDVAKRALWKVREAIEEELELLNRTTFHDLCKMIRFYKSGCANKQTKQTKTCRRLLPKAKNAVGQTASSGLTRRLQTATRKHKSN